MKALILAFDGQSGDVPDQPLLGRTDQAEFDLSELEIMVARSVLKSCHLIRPGEL